MKVEITDYELFETIFNLYDREKRFSEMGKVLLWNYLCEIEETETQECYVGQSSYDENIDIENVVDSWIEFDDITDLFEYCGYYNVTREQEILEEIKDSTTLLVYESTLTNYCSYVMFKSMEETEEK